MGGDATFAGTDTTAYSSFSGIDLIAVVDDTVIATLQGISYSITREKAPIYTFGYANPRSFSRGKRGLAGSMIFTLFDRSALYQLMRRVDRKYDYYAHEEEAYTLESNNNVWDWAARITDPGSPGGTSVSTVLRHAEYMDQIMPFNVTLIAQNEYGLSAWKAILGIEILNEGGGLSVDDITNEEQTTYVARAATAWVPWMPNRAEADPTTGQFLNFDGSNVTGESTIQAFGPENLDNYMAWLSSNPTTTSPTVDTTQP